MSEIKLVVQSVGGDVSDESHTVFDVVAKGVVVFFGGDLDVSFANGAGHFSAGFQQEELPQVVQAGSKRRHLNLNHTLDEDL